MPHVRRRRPHRPSQLLQTLLKIEHQLPFDAHEDDLLVQARKLSLVLLEEMRLRDKRIQLWLLVQLLRCSPASVSVSYLRQLGPCNELTAAGAEGIAGNSDARLSVAESHLPASIISRKRPSSPDDGTHLLHRLHDPFVRFNHVTRELERVYPEP
jgi:hypothetical protein